MSNSDDQMDTIADRELMRYFDDELDEGELAELEAALSSADGDEVAADKLVGLGLVSDILREAVDGDDRADGIADSVMAALDERSQAPSEPVPLVDPVPLQPAPTTAAPANDNARTLWTLATAAAAVAAGLFVWGNTGIDPEPHATRSRTAVEAPVEMVAPAPETIGEVAEGAGAGATDATQEDEDAVEIAQLDFGAHSGSIFKVDNKNTGVHTAVVWVTDLGDDE